MHSKARSITLASLTLAFAAVPGFSTTTASAAQQSQAPESTESGSTSSVKVNFSIPAQSLSDALTEWSRQSGLQVLRRDNDIVSAEPTSARVSGQFSPAEALDRMLAKTGLKYEFVNDRTVRIAPITSKTAAADLPSSALHLAQSDSTSQEDSAPTASKESDGSKVQEIIVTAQKRAERLQDVPISISVLNGADLDKSSVLSVTDALSNVPGVAVNVQGQNGETQITMRGVTAGNAYGNGSSPVGYYIDSVPFGLVSSAIAPDASAYDLERIEVLRGPQGTLYGAGGENGLVRLLSKDADLNGFEFKSRLSSSTTTYGGGNYRGDMAVNVPIIEGKLAARAVVGDEHLSGWLNLPGQHHANTADLRNYRLKLNAQPTDDLSIALTAWRADNHYGSSSWADDNRNGSNGDPLYPFIKPSPNDTLFTAYGFKVGYEFSAFSISSVSSYLDYNNEAFLDLRPESVPDDVITEYDSRIFSQEIILNSKNAGSWRWSGGIFYRDAKDSTFQTVIPDIPELTDLANASKSSAVFGQIGQKFHQDTLEWTLGLRYFRDKVTSQDFLFDSDTGDTFTATTPRAVLTWTPHTDLTVYGSYSQGFRSGFPQTAFLLSIVPEFASVKPDKLTNYEVGAKGNLLDRRLSFDAALYYIDWQDVQQQLTVHPPQSSVSTLLLGAGVNGSSASGMGVDLGLTLRPVDSLELGASVSWNDLTQDSDIISSDSVLFHKGDRLNFSPEYTAGLSLKYFFTLGGSGLAGRFSASSNYTSAQDSRILVNGLSLANTGDAMVISRASLSIDSGERWTGTFFADNVGNWQGVVVKQFGTNPIYYSRIRPQTFGVQLEYRFK